MKNLSTLIFILYFISIFSSCDTDKNQLQSEACIGIRLGTILKDNDESIRKQVNENNLIFDDNFYDSNPIGKFLKVEKLADVTLYYRFNVWLEENGYIRSVTAYVSPNSALANRDLPANSGVGHMKYDYPGIEAYLLKNLRAKYGEDFKVMDSGEKSEPTTIGSSIIKTYRWHVDNKNIIYMITDTGVLDPRNDDLNDIHVASTREYQII